MENLKIFKHPLLEDHLAIIRNKTTQGPSFRKSIEEISRLLFYEASRDLLLQSKKISTPMAPTSVLVIKDEIVLIPILRAGLGMERSILKAVPFAKVGHIGIKRDEETKISKVYYVNLPHDLSKTKVFLLDPMLASGGSATLAIDLLIANHAKDITYIGIIGCDQGVNKLLNHYPLLKIILAAKDPILNDKSFLVPGLGDCGDRYFGE